MANKKDEMFSLERKGDEVTAAPPDLNKTYIGEGILPDRPQTQTVTAEELQAVKDENANLRAMLESIQAQLRGKVDAPVATVSDKPAMLDESRPYAKTRTSSGGVTFEQDGLVFNARGVLMANK